MDSLNYLQKVSMRFFPKPKEYNSIRGRYKCVSNSMAWGNMCYSCRLSLLIYRTSKSLRQGGSLYIVKFYACVVVFAKFTYISSS